MSEKDTLLELAERLDRTFTTNTKGGGAGDMFATMCLMSDGLKALGSDGSLNGNTMGPREIVAALRAKASSQ